MSQKELVYAKKCVLSTRDWDTFQLILRKCLKPASGGPGTGKKVLDVVPKTVFL